jgi:uncharacterized protein YjiK
MAFLYIFLILFYTQLIDKNKELTSVADKSVLHQYNFKGGNHYSFKLPKDLVELSGITNIGKNRIFAHNDEEGIVFEIDYSTGKILKSFSLGTNEVFKDFEDIAFAQNKFFLVSSSGVVYKFTEGKNGSHVEYEVFRTGLSKENNVEGLCYDPVTNTLLIACKKFPGSGYENSRTVYSFSLKTYKLSKQPRFILKEKEIEERFDIKKISPSAITRDPVSGHFFILSSHAKAVIVVSAEGKILDAEKLSKKTHPQPEGITFSDDQTLIISDENSDGGLITYYKPKK